MYKTLALRIPWPVLMDSARLGAYWPACYAFGLSSFRPTARAFVAHVFCIGEPREKYVHLVFSGFVTILSSSISRPQMAMGQNPVPPANIPIPTKIGSKMGGAPTPNWDPIGFGPRPNGNTSATGQMLETAKAKCRDSARLCAPFQAMASRGSPRRKICLASMASTRSITSWLRAQYQGWFLGFVGHVQCLGGMSWYRKDLHVLRLKYEINGCPRHGWLVLPP